MHRIPFSLCLFRSLSSVTKYLQSSFAFGAAASLGVGLIAAAANGPVANFARQNIKTPWAPTSPATVSSKPAILTPQEQEATKVMAEKVGKGSPPPPSLPPSAPVAQKARDNVPPATPAIDQATAERMKAAEKEQFAKAAREARARAEKDAREAAEYRMKLYPDGPEARAKREKEAAEASQKVRYLSFVCGLWCDFLAFYIIPTFVICFSDFYPRFVVYHYWCRRLLLKKWSKDA